MENIRTIWYNFNHSIISLVLVIIGCYLNLGLECLLVIGGFWFGREHAQAEYRYMKLHNINRKKLKFLDGFNIKIWNTDSFFIDLVLPILISISIYLTYIYLF